MTARHMPLGPGPAWTRSPPRTQRASYSTGGPGVKTEIKIDDQEVRRALNGLIKLGRDMSPAMRSIASALESGVKDSFRSQRSPDGSEPMP